DVSKVGPARPVQLAFAFDFGWFSAADAQQHREHGLHREVITGRQHHRTADDGNTVRRLPWMRDEINEEAKRSTKQRSSQHSRERRLESGKKTFNAAVKARAHDHRGA